MKFWLLLISLFVSSNFCFAEMQTTTQDVNLRARPSAKSQSLEVISKGADVDVLSKDAGWAKVDYHGQAGYVNLKYLSENGTQEITGNGKKDYNWVWIVLVGGVVFFLLRKTVVGQYLAPNLSRFFSAFDKDKSGRQYSEYRCRACGQVTGSYFRPEHHGCSSAKTHDWRKIS